MSKDKSLDFINKKPIPLFERPIHYGARWVTLGALGVGAAFGVAHFLNPGEAGNSPAPDSIQSAVPPMINSHIPTKIIEGPNAKQGETIYVTWGKGGSESGLAEAVLGSYHHPWKTTGGDRVIVANEIMDANHTLIQEGAVGNGHVTAGTKDEFKLQGHDYNIVDLETIAQQYSVNVSTTK